jgi:DCC1-like thiol-disulfide oxidoreductase
MMPVIIPLELCTAEPAGEVASVALERNTSFMSVLFLPAACHDWLAGDRRSSSGRGCHRAILLLAWTSANAVRSLQVHVASPMTSPSFPTASSVNGLPVVDGTKGAEFFTAEDVRPVILFDGVCNLCNGGVNFILDWDQEGIYRYAALQSPAGQALLARSGRQPGTMRLTSEAVPSCPGLAAHNRSDRRHERCTISLAWSRTRLRICRRHIQHCAGHKGEVLDQESSSAEYCSGLAHAAAPRLNPLTANPRARARCGVRIHLNKPVQDFRRVSIVPLDAARVEGPVFGG